MVLADMHFLNERTFKVSKTMGGTISPTKHIAVKCQKKRDKDFFFSFKFLKEEENVGHV